MNILHVWIKQNTFSISLNPLKSDLHPIFEESQDFQNTSVKKIASKIQEIVRKNKIKSISLILSLDSKKESLLDIDNFNFFSLLKLKHLLKKQARQKGHIVMQQKILRHQNERKLYTCTGILTFYSQEFWNELKKQRDLLPSIRPYILDSEQKSEEVNYSQKDLISLAPKITKNALKKGLVFCCLACWPLSGYYLIQAFSAYRNLIPLIRKNDFYSVGLKGLKGPLNNHNAQDTLQIWHDRLNFKTENAFFILQNLLAKVHKYNFLVHAEFKIPDSFYSGRIENERHANSEPVLSFTATVSPALLYHKKNAQAFEKKILNLQAKKIRHTFIHPTEQDGFIKPLQNLSIKQKPSDRSLSISLALPIGKIKHSKFF